MVKINTFTNGIGLFYDILVMNDYELLNKNPKLVRLYQDIMQQGKEECLDFYLNQEFPHGTDIDEYREFFLEHYKEIKEETIG
jgi:hypothetical protein